jgi:hypothetical protein
MKHYFTLSLLFISLSVFCQTDNTKIHEQRANAFHQAILKSDKDTWRTFMKENFTTALIERPMRAQVSTSENDGTSSNNTTSSETKLDAKLTMFQQLHNDFGKSKISSIKVSGNKTVMILNTGTGMKGVFSLEADAKSPWLIDKLGIEVEAEN